MEINEIYQSTHKGSVIDQAVTKMAGYDALAANVAKNTADISELGPKVDELTQTVEQIGTNAGFSPVGFIGKLKYKVSVPLKSAISSTDKFAIIARVKATSNPTSDETLISLGTYKIIKRKTYDYLFVYAFSSSDKIKIGTLDEELIVAYFSDGVNLRPILNNPLYYYSHKVEFNPSFSDASVIDIYGSNNVEIMDVVVVSGNEINSGTVRTVMKALHNNEQIKVDSSYLFCMRGFDMQENGFTNSSDGNFVEWSGATIKFD